MPNDIAARAFAGKVGRVRAQLAPIDDLDLLVRCFEGEAFQRFTARGDDGVPRHADSTPVRVAYALRYAEIALGLRLPSWPLWSDPGSV